MEDFKLERRSWWNELDEDIKGLLLESVTLVQKVPAWKEKFDDYSFIVFPAAKAYEGYLKGVFLQLGFISQKDYNGKQFRIGRSLNPGYKPRFAKKGVFQKISDYCGGRFLAEQMWETWIRCRNLLFHWFPDEKNSIDLTEARERVMLIISTIEDISKSCKKV